MGIPMLKIRWSWDCLIFNMGIPILVTRHLYIEMGLCSLKTCRPESWWHRYTDKSPFLGHSYTSASWGGVGYYHHAIISGFREALLVSLNGRHFADDIVKFIFLNENVWISIQISLKFVTGDPKNNTPAFVPIMAWCGPGNKPLSQPMMVLLTHICITHPQWLKQRIVLL